MKLISSLSTRLAIASLATVIATGAAFGPTTNTWQYVASPPTNFYSSEISGAQRLPNGNTLICDASEGHIFEVTAAGDAVRGASLVVWAVREGQDAAAEIDRYLKTRTEEVAA